MYLLLFAGCVGCVSQSGGYGGQFYICGNGDAGILQGTYSEIGYVRGTIVGQNFVGQWFEVGGGTYGGGWNTGDFSIRLQPNGQRFTGIWNYAAEPGKWMPWEESRVSTAKPSPGQCMEATSSGDYRTWCVRACVVCWCRYLSPVC